MEDFILREIDRIGEMLMHIARRLGLLDGDEPDYSMADVPAEFTASFYSGLGPMLVYAACRFISSEKRFA